MSFKNILIHIDDIERWVFFERMLCSFKKMDVNYNIITDSLFIHNLLNKKGYECFLLEKNPMGIISIPEFIIEETIERKLGLISYEKGEKFFSIVYQICEKIYKKNPFDLIFIFNGSKIVHQALKYYALQKSIKTLFFEIGNLPGKLFVDPEGVNAKSKLYKNIDLLLNFKIPTLEFENWRKSYINTKLNCHQVPQATYIYQLNIKRNLWQILIDKYYIGYITNNYLSVFKDLAKKSINRCGYSKTIDYDSNISLERDKYIFFPLQVKSDSQLIINSNNMNNITGLENALELAKQKNMKLFVKTHPGENNAKHIADICKLRKKLNFYLINENTFKLINNAQLILTINSTVGLEALILGKQVKCLGNAIYKKFTDAHLSAYILRYLLNIDYFSNELIPIERIVEIFNRVEKN